MARIATAPRFAPDTRKTLSRDPRDFHHGLLRWRLPLTSPTMTQCGLSEQPLWQWEPQG